MHRSAVCCMLALSLLSFSGYSALRKPPTAAGATTRSGAAARPCAAVLDLVGLPLIEARAYARRCHQVLGYVYRLPNVAHAGTVVSESQPSTGNRLVVSSGPLANAWAVLPGATGPPVAAECTATLRLAEDGTAGPLTCFGDHVNVEAWDYYELLHPSIMRLPRGLTACRAVLHVVGPLSTPENIDAFVLANVYNGWHIPFAFVQHVLDVGPPNNDTCPSPEHSAIGKG